MPNLISYVGALIIIKLCFHVNMRIYTIFYRYDFITGITNGIDISGPNCITTLSAFVLYTFLGNASVYIFYCACHVLQI